jgi:hypothetical protein
LVCRTDGDIPTVCACLPAWTRSKKQFALELLLCGAAIGNTLLVGWQVQRRRRRRWCCRAEC